MKRKLEEEKGEAAAAALSREVCRQPLFFCQFLGILLVCFLWTIFWNFLEVGRFQVSLRKEAVSKLEEEGRAWLEAKLALENQVKSGFSQKSLFPLCLEPSD